MPPVGQWNVLFATSISEFSVFIQIFIQRSLFRAACGSLLGPMYPFQAAVRTLFLSPSALRSRSCFSCVFSAALSTHGCFPLARIVLFPAPFHRHLDAPTCVPLNATRIGLTRAAVRRCRSLMAASLSLFLFAPPPTLANLVQSDSENDARSSDLHAPHRNLLASEWPRCAQLKF